MVTLSTQVGVNPVYAGSYEFENRKSAWAYAYEVEARGTRSEKRVGRLLLDHKPVEGKQGEGVTTPWGLMQLFQGSYEQGWLLEGTYGTPIAPVGRAFIPDGALEASGEWSATITSWNYRLHATAMGSKSETRSGRLIREGSEVNAENEGARIDTPWGLMHWMGKPHDTAGIVPGDHEAGWLLRGTSDRELRCCNEPIGRTGTSPSEALAPIRSMYLASSPLGHGVSLAVPCAMTDEWDAVLTLDPNICMLNEFGDRVGCTRIALRSIPVEVTRLRLADPLCHGRSIFRITAPELTVPMVLVSDALFERFHLKTDSEVIPLFRVESRP